MHGEVLGVRPCTSVLCGRDDCRCSSGLHGSAAPHPCHSVEALSGRAGLQCASIAATNRSTARLRASVHHQLSVAASCERLSAFTARRSEGLAAKGLVRTTVKHSAEILQRCGHGAPWRPLLAATSLAHTQQASVPAARPHFQGRRVPLRLRASRAGRFTRRRRRQAVFARSGHFMGRDASRPSRPT